MKKLPLFTKRRLEAALAAVDAGLAGEEGEGDLAETAHVDLHGARACLAARLGLTHEEPSKIVPPSASVLRGLDRVHTLAKADLDGSEPDDFGSRTREDIENALDWIWNLTRR